MPTQNLVALSPLTDIKLPLTLNGGGYCNSLCHNQMRIPDQLVLSQLVCGRLLGEFADVSTAPGPCGFRAPHSFLFSALYANPGHMKYLSNKFGPVIVKQVDGEMRRLALCVFPFVMLIIWIDFTEATTEQNSTGEYKVKAFTK